MNSLPRVELNVSARSEQQGKEDVTRVTIANPGKSLAFFIRLKINRGGGEEILPVIWEDNYVSLLPGETRVLSATYARDHLHGAPARGRGSGVERVAKDDSGTVRGLNQVQVVAHPGSRFVLCMLTSRQRRVFGRGNTRTLAIF